MPLGAQESLFEDPLQLITAFGNMVKEIEDYQCRISEWSVFEDDAESRVVNFYFKRPRLMRMDVIIGTRIGDKGSRSIHYSDCRVVGKMKYLPFVRKMSLDHPAVTTNRGKTLQDTDLIGIHSTLVRYFFASDMSLANDGVSYILRVEHSDPTLYDGLKTEIIEFEIESLLPTAADGFSSYEHVQRFVFSLYAVNTGLPEELFNIRYDARKLSGTGVAPLVEIPLKDVDIADSRFTEG